jgi:hypothetical protein
MEPSSASVGEIEALLGRADEFQLSRRARERLSWLRHYALTDSVTDTCRHFQIPRVTLYRLLRRFDPSRPSSLEDRSTRPHRGRVSAAPVPAARRGGETKLRIVPETARQSQRMTDRWFGIPASLCVDCRRKMRRTLVLASVLLNLILTGILLIATVTVV